MWPNHDETIELLGGAKQGDANAVDRLMDRHRDRLADVYRRELADKRDVGREQRIATTERSTLDPLAQARDAQLTPAAMLLKKEFAERFQHAVEQLDEGSK